MWAISLELIYTSNVFNIHNSLINLWLGQAFGSFVELWHKNGRPGDLKLVFVILCWWLLGFHDSCEKIHDKMIIIESPGLFLLFIQRIRKQVPHTARSSSGVISDGRQVINLGDDANVSWLGFLWLLQEADIKRKVWECCCIRIKKRKRETQGSATRPRHGAP